MSNRPAYRADIDGLRAVAVGSVILHHMRQSWVPGGYTGVDIFFVISGFLISRNIWEELARNHFSIVNFYLRRIRRIGPAFLVVTGATLIAGSFLLLPAELRRLAASSVWGALSGANVYFWKYLDTSYFAPTSGEVPLLHLWSLGVEEQFYLVWPALLYVLWWMGGPRWLPLALTLLLCVASTVLAELTNVSAQPFAYYMLPARAGELGVGALLALLPTDAEGRASARLKGWPAEALFVLGVLSIGWGLFGLDDHSAFPGVNALYPCLGAALVMLGGQHDSRLASVVLANRPAVFIGLISYSLYLWHWPLLAFVRYFHGTVSTMHALAAGIATLVLSVLSYRFVEQPARLIRASATRQVVLLYAAPVSALLLGAGWLIHTDGLKTMIASNPRVREAASLTARTRPATTKSLPCFSAPGPVAQVLVDARCVLGAKEPPSVFLWGDSHAAHYANALRAIGAQAGFSFRYATLQTCPALFGGSGFGMAKVREQCTRFRQGVEAHLASRDYRVVVLGAQWSIHARNLSFEASLQRTIAALEAQGKDVVLLGEVPRFEKYSPDCAQRWSRLGDGNCERRYTRRRSRPEVSRHLADVAARSTRTRYVDIDNVLCTSTSCKPYLGGLPVYFNPTHLSFDGSQRIGQKILKSPSRCSWLDALAAVVPAARRAAVLDGKHCPGP
jgi:peptidoglycan/LPS O-acetylase OafA/YrhL